ncbi:MAG: gamma-glutamylcyclotransferase [Deltaproteobacteria bacterium]|nr:gamma-glutamylcyclotransferase [Deltaproteobacteria bacterium]
MSVLVFAYGSNLCLERLRARTPSARALTAGMLRRHALRWHKRSLDGSGKCDALATGDSADLVWGAVYELSATDKLVLDRFEGLGDDYFEREVVIETPGASMAGVVVYLANPRWIDAAVRPYSWYKDFVVRGAAQHRLPGNYRAAIEAIDALEDPDRSRHRREVAVLAAPPPAMSAAGGAGAADPGAIPGRRPRRPDTGR